jgi:hypothetical protein
MARDRRRAGIASHWRSSPASRLIAGRRDYATTLLFRWLSAAGDDAGRERRCCAWRGDPPRDWPFACAAALVLLRFWRWASPAGCREAT